MRRLASILALTALPLLASAPVQDEEAAAPVLYPPRLGEHAVHFVSATGEVDADAIREEIAKLGDGSELVFGPASSPTRPSNTVFALTLVPDAKDREARRLVKKGARKPATLEITAVEFVRPDGSPYDLTEEFGDSAVRGQLLGMTSEMRWVFAAGAVLTCVYEPGRTKSDELLGRLRTEAASRLDGPFDVRLLTDEIVWTLEGEVEPKRAKRLEKDLLGLPGVVEAAVDGPGARVRLVVSFDRLTVTGPWLGMDGVEGELPRPLWYANPALEAAVEAGFRLP